MTDKMAQFFQSNPFSSPVGQRIEHATEGNLASEDWALNMEICDIINESDDGPKDAIRAIRKRLTTTIGKNNKSVMYTLIVLETAVKNCNKRFHVQVANKDFLQDLVKIIGPKNDPPQIVQEKVLSLIQTWADAFRGQTDLKEVEKVYSQLKNNGIDFPMTDLDHMAPIHTPARSVPEAETQRVLQQSQHPQHLQQQQQQPSPNHVPQAPLVQDSGPVNPTPEQLSKLRSELDIVQGNLRVFSEMLNEMTPGQEDASDLDLLQELNRTCRQMQSRIVELLDRISNDEVIGELLQVNDDLNNMFIRYERFERYRTGTQQQTAEPTETDATIATATSNNLPPSYDETVNTDNSNLIDFGESNEHQPMGISAQLAGMNIGTSNVSSTLGQMNSTSATTAGGQSDEFDMFAQSRTSFDQSKQSNVPASYSDQQQKQFHGLSAAVTAKSNITSPNNMNVDDNNLKLMDNEEELDEMQKWVNENTEAAAKPEDSVTSAEFDQFLEERATDDDSLSRGPARSTRKLQKDDADNALFAL
ncbi:TOM1-like protein 2 isoform X2 [Tubulanus polymorphus]|uniref:TOM1-like protein 2 isoform X2 n=1 Tax=Tubulanus polymorphus TaxID=672921 RepID=UPI003DA53464